VRRGNAFAACERVLASMPRQSHASALPLRPASVDQQLSFGSIASELGPGLRVHRCSRVVARRVSRGPSSTDSRTEQERTDLSPAGPVQSQLRAFLARGRRADLRPIPRARTGSFTQPHQRALCRSQRAERSAGTPVGRDTARQRIACAFEQRARHHSRVECGCKRLRRYRPKQAGARSAETRRVSSTDRAAIDARVRRTRIE
jgi:hypothetical protein